MTGVHSSFDTGMRRPTEGAGQPVDETSIESFEDTARLKRLDLPSEPTVLLVDDDPLVLARLRDVVAGAGYGVRTAVDGLDALRCMQQDPSPIIVTDVNMPGMDGLELCRKVRAQSWPGYVYIVLLTVQDEEIDILRGLDAGADDHLSKRTSTAQFKARLRIAKRMLALEYSLKDALEKKRVLAMTDPLTGAYNRRYFIRHLGREIKRSQRHGGEVALLLLDVDHFKQVNDRHGHETGDSVLQQITVRVAACLRRSTDWCARLGGEEFGVVLEGTTLAEANDCAERLREAIAASPFTTPSGAVRITLSIGVSGLEQMPDRQAASVQTLLDAADKNLYASKAAGRNRVTSPQSATATVRACKFIPQEPRHAEPQDTLRLVRR